MTTSNQFEFRTARKAYQPSWQRWLFTLWLVFFSTGLAVADTQVTPIPQLDRADISRAWHICATPAQTTLDQVIAGNCLQTFPQPARNSWGFDSRALWMHVILENTSDQPSDRLLTIGHPRLQEVALFEMRDGQLSSRRDSGINVPLADKPLPMTRPAFDLRFEPGEHKDLWLRVASETTIDLNTELWLPKRAYLVEQRLQFFETLALGLMLLCMLYSLGAFAMHRDSLMLYFGLFLGAEFILELNRSGLMQLYLWPVSLPFDARILGSVLALAMISFTLLLRAFLAPIQRFPVAYAIYLATVWLCLAGIGWSLLVDYRVGTQWWTMAILLLVGSVLALVVNASHRGQNSANLLLQSFAVMLLFESLQILSVLGWIESIDIGTLLRPWAMALATSFILINMNRRSQEMLTALAKSEKESTDRLHFMSQMSHELRSPLTTMLGQIKLMAPANISQQMHNGLQAIWRDARQLLAMIDDILDYAQGSAGHKGLHPVPRTWGQLLQHIGRNAKVLGQTRGGNQLVLSATGAAETPLMVDERRLQQVLNNLLTNAARYTHQGEISLTCAIEPIRGADPASAWRLSFSVSDTGEGIDLQDQERIFEPFQRGEKAHLSSHKGIGMGLAIARQLVLSMGGTISLSSQSGQGSCFSFDVVCAGALPEDFENLDEDMAFLQGDDDEWPAPETITTTALAVSDEQLALPGAALLADLKQLVDNGQLTDLMEWANALEKASPDMAAYCQRVRQAARELDIPELLALCELNAPYPSSDPHPPRPAAAP